MEIALVIQTLVWGGWFLFAVIDLSNTLKKSLIIPKNRRQRRSLELNIAISIPINIFILLLSTLSLLNLHL